MYILFVPPPAWGLPSMSAAGVKLDTYLRWRRFPYENRPSLAPSLVSGAGAALREPSGRLLMDSRVIVSVLEGYAAVELAPPLDGGRDASSLAQLHALQGLIEGSLAWNVGYARWSDRQSKQAMLRAWGKQMGRWPQPFARRRVAARAREELRAHGIGWLHPDEAFELGKRDVRTLVELLADEPYFGGERPSCTDASAFGVLASLVVADVDTPLKAYAQSQPAVSAYVRRVRAELGFSS